MIAMTTTVVMVHHDAIANLGNRRADVGAHEFHDPARLMAGNEYLALRFLGADQICFRGG